MSANEQKNSRKHFSRYKLWLKQWIFIHICFVENENSLVCFVKHSKRRLNSWEMKRKLREESELKIVFSLLLVFLFVNSYIINASRFFRRQSLEPCKFLFCIRLIFSAHGDDLWREFGAPIHYSSRISQTVATQVQNWILLDLDTKFSSCHCFSYDRATRMIEK